MFIGRIVISKQEVIYNNSNILSGVSITIEENIIIIVKII